MVRIQGFPIYPSYNSVWVTGSTMKVPSALNYGKLGYQRYYEPNSISNPDKLGGRWYGKSRKKRSKKSKKRSKKRVSRKRSKKRRRSRKFGNGTGNGAVKETVNDGEYRQLTPGGITTQKDWGFSSYGRRKHQRKRRSRKNRRNRKRSKKRRSRKRRRSKKRNRKK